MELVSKYFSLLQRQNKLQNAEFDDEAQTYTMIFRQTQSRGGGGGTITPEKFWLTDTAFCQSVYVILKKQSGVKSGTKMQPIKKTLLWSFCMVRP